MENKEFLYDSIKRCRNFDRKIELLQKVINFKLAVKAKNDMLLFFSMADVNNDFNTEIALKQRYI